MNNIRKFETEADYSAATLNYPAVSWVTSGDTVHYDKTAPVGANDKVIMSFSAESADYDIVLFNGGISGSETGITSCTLNDVDVLADLYDGTLQNASSADTIYVSKVGFVGNEVGDYFSGELGGGWSSPGFPVDFLIPAKVTEITHVPSNTCNLVVEATTPPTTSVSDSSLENFNAVYVPDESVSAYQTSWGNDFTNIYPISQYQGNLPI